MNQPDVDTGTKLRRAAEKGRLEEVRALLASGAPVMKDAVRINSWRTLEHKKKFLHCVHVRFPPHKQNGLSALHKAARKGHTGVVRALISSGKFKLNAGDKVCM